MNRKYHIKTFGCQMNWSDSERIATVLEKNNFKPAENISEADLVIFNTCGVRQMAEDRVYGQIHNLKLKAQSSKRKARIILTGCLANRKDVQGRLKDKVDLFFPINDFKKFENWIIGNCLEIRNSELEISEQNNTALNKESIAYLSIRPKHANKYQAFVPIMTGCNNFCAYCVVPYARGREVSRPAGEIISEVKNLVKNGYKEIILLGQNVNSYDYQSQNASAAADKVPVCNASRSDAGRQNRNAKFKTYNFSKLLKEINKIPGKFWISFMSNHPKDVTDEMIKTVAQCQKVCEYFHLPLQAGNDEILKKMNRKYTAKQYLESIRKIKAAYKKHKPGKMFAITSDIIVGFPGETKKQFLDSAEVMKKVKYDMVYFGQYSPRPSTAAWQIKDNVSKAEKVRRENFLNKILKKTSFENNKKYVGRILEVLVEEEKNGFCFGKMRTMKNVKIPAIRSSLVGKLIEAKITKANIWNLEGELVTRNNHKKT